MRTNRQGTRRDVLVLGCLACTLVGGLLRLWHIGSKSLWIDEAFSVWVGWQPIPDALAWLVRVDQHPPLYYLLLHLWMRLGDDAATVRALSALLSMLNIPVVYLLGRRLVGAKVGLAAAAILALSPFHICFAQEARMYALLSLNASLATWALARLLTDSRAATLPVGRQFAHAWRTWRATGGLPARSAIETDLSWGVYALSAAATVWTHNTAVLYLVASNVYVLGLAWVRGWCLSKDARLALQPPAVHNWIAAQLAILALWSPWLWAFVRQSTAVLGEFWLSAPTWGTVVGVLQDFTCAFLPSHIGWSWAIWAFYGALLCLGVFRLRKQRTRLALLLLLFLVPLAGEWLISLWRPIFYDRTLIWASIPLYLLLALGICQLRYRSFILVAAVIVATVSGLSVREYNLHFQKEQWDDAAAYVSDRAEPRDLVLFHATWVQIPFDYYFRGYGLPQGVDERGVPVDLFDRGVLEPKMTAHDLPRLAALIQDRERVWLVYSHQGHTDPQGLVVAGLNERMTLRSRRRFYGLEVRLYVRGG
jgi:mannosyltransferase